MYSYVVISLAAVSIFAASVVGTSDAFGDNVGIEAAGFVGSVHIISKNYSHVGSATLLNTAWAITSRSILSDTISDNELRFGSANNGNRVIVPNIRNIVHISDEEPIWDSNIALVQFEDDITFALNCYSILVATNQELAVNGDQVSFYGFGVDSNLGGGGHLKKLDVPLLEFDNCNLPQNAPLTDANALVCTKELGPITCELNLGSPLVYKERLIGIYNGKVYPCGSSYSPEIFVDISKYSQWINETTY